MKILSNNRNNRLYFAFFSLCFSILCSCDAKQWQAKVTIDNQSSSTIDIVLYGDCSFKTVDISCRLEPGESLVLGPYTFWAKSNCTDLWCSATIGFRDKIFYFSQTVNNYFEENSLYIFSPHLLRHIGHDAYRIIDDNYLNNLIESGNIYTQNILP